jgi:mannose-6-phosphate isomerase-like protein (cupin superfamily)
MITLTTAPLSARRTRPAAVTHGAALEFETIRAFDGAPAPLRVRAAEDTLLRVIDGVLRLTVDGADRLLAIGDEAIVPAGARHRLAGAAGEVRVVIGFRASP